MLVRTRRVPLQRVGAVALMSILVTGAAVRAAGELDPDFGTGGKVITALHPANVTTQAVLVQADGAIVIAGSIATTFGDALVARYAPDGTLDPTFSAGPVVVTPLGTSTSYFLDVVQQADGTLVAAGLAKDAGGDYDGALVRYLADGSLDASFGAGGIVRTPLGSAGGAFTDVLVDPDGKLVTAGSAVGVVVHGLVARYLADGSLDATFGSGGLATTDLGDVGFNALARQADGGLVAAGVAIVGPTENFVVARFDADGTLDATFGSGGIVVTPIGALRDFATGVVVQPDGKIVVAGSTLSAGASMPSRVAVVRYLADGTLDATFGLGGIVTTMVGNSTYGADLLRQPDGKLVVAGSAFDGARYDFVLIRYLADGSLDAGFGAGGAVATQVGPTSDNGFAVARQADAKLVVAGVVADAGGNVGDIGLVRYYGEGSPPSTTSTLSTTTTSATTTSTPGSSTSTSGHPTSSSSTSTSTSSSTSTTSPGCTCANPCEVCDAQTGCHAPDAATCGQALARRAALTLRDDPNAVRDRLTWKWKSAAAVARADFGDPTATDAYALCVLDRTGGVDTLRLVASVPAGGLCAGKACWTATSTGFRYADRNAASDGIRTIRLQAGVAGRARASVKAKGPNLGMPPLGLTAPVTARLVRIGGGACWEARFSAPARSDAAAFSAKSD